MNHQKVPVLLCLWILSVGHGVEGNCSGGVTSQSIQLGNSGLTELMLRKVTRPLVCTWEVKSPTNGLHLDLTAFTFPESDLCREGSLQITVGEYGKYDSVALDKWCGEFYPRSLQLAGHVTITLRLQPTESRAGFKIKFTSIPPSQFCAHPAVNLSGSGLLYSPGFGGHWSVAPVLSCDWQIAAGSGHVVQIEILKLDFSEWACSKRQAELVAYDGNVHLNQIGSWCKSHKVGVVRSSRDSLHLTYTNQVPHRGSGFLLKYYPVNDYNTHCAPFPRDVIARSTPTFISISEAPSSGDVNCRWNITTERPGDIVVMETVHQNLGSIGCVYVELDFFDGDSPDEAHLQRRVCSGIELTSNNVIESSGSQAYLEITYNDISPSVEGIDALVKLYSVPKDRCRKTHRIYRADRDTSRLWISREGSTNRVCDITIQSSTPNACVKVAISSKVLSLYDFFDIYDGANSSSPRYTSTCSPVGKAYTYSTGNTLLLQYRLSPLTSNVTGDSENGFWLDFSANSDCEIGDFEVIQANNPRANPFYFPSHQGHGRQVCRYLIQAPRREVIQLYLSSFPTSVSSHSNCTSPAVIVADDIGDGHVIGQWCSGRGDDYISQSNRVYIQYIDDSMRSVQPSVVYRIKPREQCHEFLSAPHSGPLTLTSPYFPVFYPNNADCSWKIRALRPNYRVQVEVLEVHMGPGPGHNCSGDYVALHTETGVTRLCESEIVKRPIRSRGPVMQVDFHSDGQITDRGFKFSYKSIKSYQCNESLEADTRTGTEHFLSSPFFPDYYTDAMKCFYLLQTTESRLIQTLMDLAELGGSGGKCSGDSLTFHDGRSATAPVIGRVCGSELSEYRSTGRYMYLVFQSNSDGVTHRGFQLHYYSVFKYDGCDGASIGRVYGNTSHTGHILSPFYPRGFPQDTTCQWRVYVGSGYQVQVSVSTSAMSFNCRKFQVKFYDGAQSRSASLGSWCGGKGSVFTSSQDVMTVTLQSHNLTRSGFKLAYIATGAGPAASRTALVLGIIIGAVVLVVIIFTVIIVCCCCFCRDKRRNKRRARRDTESEKRGTDELAETLQGDKPSSDESYKTHLIVPSAPPMEGVDNSGYINHEIGKLTDAIQLQPLYPDLAPMHNTASPDRVQVQMVNCTDVPSRPHKLPEPRRSRGRSRGPVGEVRVDRVDQAPLIHQHHVRNSSSRPEGELSGPGGHLAIDEVRITGCSRLEESEGKCWERREQKPRSIERTQANHYPVVKGTSDEDEGDITKRHKIGKKNNMKGKKDAKKHTERKSDKRLHKEKLNTKSSIECDNSDPEDAHLSGWRSSRARQHCDDNGLRPAGSSPFDDVPSMSHPGNILYHENGRIDLNYASPQGYMYPNYYENCYLQTSPCCRESWIDDTINHHLNHCDYHYPTVNPSSQYNPSQTDMVNQHRVHADVHPYPVVSPALYPQSLLYQNHGNIYSPSSYFPHQSCECPMYMTSVPLAAVPQQIWSTGDHLLPQGPFITHAEPRQTSPLVHYQSLDQVRPVPLLVPINEDSVKADTQANGATPESGCLTTLEESTETDTSQFNIVDASQTVTAEGGVEDAIPPDPSRLANLLPPSHWIRRSIRTWPVDIPCTLSSTDAYLPKQEETSDARNHLSFEEESADHTCDQVAIKHCSDSEEKNYPSVNENEVQQFALTEQDSCDVETSSPSEGPPQIVDKGAALMYPGAREQDRIEKYILDTNQKQHETESTGQTENEKDADEDLVQDVLQEQNEMMNVEAEEAEQDTDHGSTKDMLHKKQELLLPAGFTLEDVHNLDETSV